MILGKKKLKLISLSSSSRGNVHILENSKSTILLDCGVKFNKIEQELNNVKLDGILITHEHGDHIGGCKSLAENKLVSFYSTKETLDKINIPEFDKYAIKPTKTFSIASFNIVAFEVHHDAAYPVNYLIKDNLSGAQLLYITDTGNLDDIEIHDVDYILIECNFDEKWYQKEELSDAEKIKKKRLLGDKGHLSIQKTIEFLKRTINHNTKKIILCHISHGFDGYQEFEKRVQKELNFENVVALNPQFIGPVVNMLEEEKEVMPFE